MDSFKKLNTFCKRWLYQQEAYLKLIRKNLISYLSHFPMGYINLLFQLIITIVSIPIYIGHILEFLLASILIVKPTTEDVAKVTSDLERSLMAKAQIRAIEEYKESTKILVTFLLGIITAVLTFRFIK